MFEQKRTDGRRLLKRNAIPTIFSHTPEKKSRKSPKKRSPVKKTFVAGCGFSIKEETESILMDKGNVSIKEEMEEETESVFIDKCGVSIKEEIESFIMDKGNVSIKEEIEEETESVSIDKCGVSIKEETESVRKCLFFYYLNY
ncbi:unnamed protein product [Nezara viridula]|uniref:Uncharacterized protein n=1 Tax=Nezara viridula TaxID=85310 RepID=A0A9P0E4W0_NEZVI|nr:unnamed protein product [Nezara viridula]